MPYLVTITRPTAIPFVAGGHGWDSDEYGLVDNEDPLRTTTESFAVATLEERICFNGKEWRNAGFDQPDGNLQFFHHVLLLNRRVEYDGRHAKGEEVADVLWLHDGSISRGHFVNSMEIPGGLTRADRKRYPNFPKRWPEQLIPWLHNGSFSRGDKTIKVELTTYRQLTHRFKILQFVDDDPHWSFLDDVHELLWPTRNGQVQEGDNHVAQDVVIQALRERGCRPNIERRWLTPFGFVEFDSEADALGMYATTREPIEYVLDVVEDLMSAEARAHIINTYNSKHGINT